MRGYSVAIQHTVRREGDPVFEQLQKDVGYPPPCVVTDLDTSPGNRTWQTYRLCLESIYADHSHILVLQDDVSLCRNFFSALEQVLQARPTDLVSFFLGNKPSSSVIELFRACDRGDRYSQLDSRTWVPAQALLWPRERAAQMLVYADTHYRFGRPDDELIGEFLHDNQLWAWQTIPTLAQHEGAFGVHSTLRAGGGHYRRAACYIGEHDPLEIDWS